MVGLRDLPPDPPACESWLAREFAMAPHTVRRDRPQLAQPSRSPHSHERAREGAAREEGLRHKALLVLQLLHARLERAQVIRQSQRAVLAVPQDLAHVLGVELDA